MVNFQDWSCGIGKESTFRGIIDLLNMEADIYYDELGKDMRVEPIPEDMLEEAKKYRADLVEAVVETDDELMEKYLMGEEPTVPIPDFADAYQTQRVLEAALLSAAERRPVERDEEAVGPGLDGREQGEQRHPGQHALD